MMPLMPPLALWGSPLYNELYVGLCRALAGPWLGGLHAYRAGTEGSAEMPADHGRATDDSDSRRHLAARDGWRLLHGRQSDADPIGARTLAELSRTVRDRRDTVLDDAG